MKQAELLSNEKGIVERMVGGLYAYLLDYDLWSKATLIKIVFRFPETNLKK